MPKAVTIDIQPLTLLPASTTEKGCGLKNPALKGAFAMSSDRNVLIVGGAGYIGSHTTLALNAAGYTTVVYDNFLSGHRDACWI